MAINHDMIRKAVEAHKAKTGHDATYYDGGAPKIMTKIEAAHADSEHKARRAAVEREGLELRKKLRK